MSKRDSKLFGQTQRRHFSMKIFCKKFLPWGILGAVHRPPSLFSCSFQFPSRCSHWRKAGELRPPAVGTGGTFCPLLWAFFPFNLQFHHFLLHSLPTGFNIPLLHSECPFFVIVKETKNSSPSRECVALIQSHFGVQEHYQMLLPDAQWNIN